MSLLMTRQKSTESTSEEEEDDLESHPSVMISSVDEIMDDRPPFCLNEEQRKMKTFHERKTDLNAAIEWIVKEIKILKQQDQKLMKQFVQLRGVLNSIKNCPPSPVMSPVSPIDRKISLPETSPNSPFRPPSRIAEKSSERYYRDEASPGLRRRAVSDNSGRSLLTYSMSSLSFDESDFTNENFEHFAI